MKMMIVIVLAQQSLLEQSSGAKINYSNIFAARCCAGGVWGRLCFAKSAVEVLGVHPKFACTLRILRANEVKIAQGSSLARISLPCGAAVVIVI